MFCGICNIRISEWMKATGKTITVEGKECHKSCLIDHKLKTGKDWKP